MALGRGTFENAFAGISPYNNVERKPQELSPSGSSRNQPIGTAFSSNIGSNTSKMGFFGKKDEPETNHSDLFYSKTFPAGRNNLADNLLSNQMNSMNLYGFNKTKEQMERSSSPNWASSGWSQMGGSFPQGLGSNSLSSNMTPPSASRQSSINSNLLQFSRSISSQSFSNNISASAGLQTSQSSTDQLANTFQNNFKIMSGQSSPRSGLLSMSQQLPNSSQQQQQSQQQSQRGVIGQLPAMQGHSSPSHSPGLNVSNKLQVSQPSRSTILPTPSSNVLPNSSLANSTSLPGFVGGLPMRSNGHFGQSILNTVIPSSQSPSGNDTTTTNINNLTSNQQVNTSSNMNNVIGGPQNAFDTDFPALANRMGNSASSRPGQNSFSFVMSTGSKAIEGNQEFQIQNEDFPALPGAPSQQLQGDGVLPTTQLGAITQPAIQNHIGQHLENKDAIGDNYSLPSSYEQILKDGRLNLDKKLKTPVSGIQTNSSGVITNIPSGMVTDQFGMIGLLTFIRAAETEPNLVTLALGSDLTTLGLNLNSTESLYHTFGSPFSDTTCKPHEIDFYAPQEYLISSYIRDKLAPIKLGRYGEDLLFYLYYTNCGDILQLAAAAELFARDWRYHKDERVWITRFPGMEPQIKTNTYERGTYYYFDPQGWRKVAKEFHVEYERLETKPTAQALQQQQQQQQQQQLV